MEALEQFDVNECEIKTVLRSPKSTPNGRTKAKAPLELSDEEKRQIFDSVYDDIYEVVLPNTLWGIHRDPEERQYIVFTLFDAIAMKCSIAVKITDTFTLTISDHGEEKTANTLNELSVETLSKLLSELNENTNLDCK